MSANMTKYYEYNRKFYTLVLTLKSAFIRLVRFLISIFPLFVAYLLLGMVVFGPYSFWFDTFPTGTDMLFGLVTGDNTTFAFEMLTKDYPYPIIGWIYLYSYLPIFITVVWDIFFFIVNDAYYFSKLLVRKKDITVDLTDIGYGMFSCF